MADFKTAARNSDGLDAEIAAGQFPGEVTPADGPDMLTVADVAEHCRLSRSTVYALMNAGKLPYVKLGRARRVHPMDVMKLNHDPPRRRVTIVGNSTAAQRRGWIRGLWDGFGIQLDDFGAKLDDFLDVFGLLGVETSSKRVRISRGIRANWTFWTVFLHI